MSADEVILLAGGLGTRLRAEVPDVPKPLAPVAERPFLLWLLDAYAAAGMRRVILAIGYRGEQIASLVGDAWCGMTIAYSREETPLGTGGAVVQAAALVQGEGVHLANADTYLRYSPSALEVATRQQDALLGVALASVPDVGRYGAVDVAAGRVVGFREKGGHGDGLINAGSYFLTREGLAALPRRRAYSFEEQVLLPWSRAGRLAAFTATSAFMDIGVPEDYRRAQTVLAAP